MDSRTKVTKKLLLQPSDRLANSIGSGVQFSLQTLFKILPTPGPFRLEKECTVRGDVTGVIVMTQENAEGTFNLTFPKATLFNLLEFVFNRKFTEVDTFVQSSVGEMTNVIYGLLKAGLNSEGYDFKMNVPQIVFTAGHEVVSREHGETLVVPFDTNFGSFYVSINASAKTASTKAA
jgi:chemotaxis protein CheX